MVGTFLRGFGCKSQSVVKLYDPAFGGDESAKLRQRPYSRDVESNSITPPK